MRALLKLAILLATAWLSVAAAHAQPANTWVRIQTVNFDIYSSGNEDKARALALDLEAYRAAMILRSPPPRMGEAAPLRIVITNTPSDFSKVRPGMGSTVAGFYTATPDLISAYSTFKVISEERGGGRSTQRRQTFVYLDEREVLFHEYAHHFMLQYFPGYYPAWYIEGFAEFYMTMDFTRDHIEIGNMNLNRTDWLNNTTWLPLETILQASPSSLSREGNAMFYAQSWMLVHYLTFKEERQEGLVRYLTAVRRGEDPIAAFEPAFGITVQAMQQELRAYMRQPINRLRYARSVVNPPTEITVTPLPASADAVFLTLDRLRLGNLSKDDATEVLLDLNRSAGANNADVWFLRARAWANLRAQRFEDARADAQALLALAPNDAEAHELIGNSHLGQVAAKAGEQLIALDEAALAQLDAARAAYSAALAIQPGRASALYGRAFALGVADANRDERIASLQEARRRAPQVASIGLTLSYWLIEAGRDAEALRVLRPIAANPHGGPLAEQAKTMMDQIAAKASVAPPAP